MMSPPHGPQLSHLQIGHEDSLTGAGLKVHLADAPCLCLLHRQDDPRHSSGSPEDTPRSSGASSIFDLRNLAADSLLPSLLERTAPEDVDRRNEAARRQHRPRALLALYPAPDEVGAHKPTRGPYPRTRPCMVPHNIH